MRKRKMVLALLIIVGAIGMGSAVMKHVHQIDGGKVPVNMVSGVAYLGAYSNSGQLSQEIFDQLASQNVGKTGWNQWLSGISEAALDSYSSIPGGPAALKTTDPKYLAMGAQPIYHVELPAFLQGF